MNKKLSILLLLGLFIFCISFASAAITTTLNSPVDDSIAYVNLVTFNASASVTGGATLVNMSLWTNESGSWELKTKKITKEFYFPWVSNSTIINGLADVGSHSTPNVFELNNNYYLVSGNIDGTFVGYVWSGSTWVSNSTIINGLADVGSYSTPNVFELNNNYYLVSGNIAGTFSGYIISYNSFTNFTQTFDQTITDDIIWNVQACDSDGDCGFATTNYTVILDTTSPAITVQSPSGTLDYNAIGQEETLNVTFTDTNLDSCWYNYNGTNISIEGCLTGVKNSTTFILEENNFNMTIYGNDTAGNLNSKFIEWDYKILETSLTYNEEVLDLSLEDFILYVKSTEEITSSKLHYDGNIYDSSILSLGSGLYKISNSIQIPDVAVDTNYTFYFNLTTPTAIIKTESNIQSVYVLLIDNCGVYTNEIFNISLYDEKTLELLLGTIEVNLELFNNDKSTALTTAVSNFYNMNNMRICSNVNLTGTGYFYDLELRYYVDPTNTSTFLYVPEFYHIQKASISNFPQSIDLFNLNVNQSTEFTMYYRDNNYVARENVLLQIERKYISEGIYRTVEIPITSNEGSALGHFDLDNYKYKIIATLNGEILNVFENPAIVCESELSGICTLNLNGQGSANPFEDYDTINDIAYYISFNDTDILVSYVIPSGETRQVNVYMYQVSSFADDKILCNSTLTSSAGTFICSPNATIGDSNVFIEIRIDGVLQPMNKIYFQEDLGDYFNLNNYAIASLFLILFITMMVSSPIIMVASSVFSVVILAFLFLLKGSSIGLVLGSFSWLAIAGILILVKLNKKDET